MKVELPKLKRCCFCLPLRYGLITCGYLRLVLLLVMFSFATYYLVTHPNELTIGLLVIKITFLLLLLVDTSVTVVFLIGGHQKTVKLLRVSYIYNIVLLCIFALFFTWAIVYDFYNMENLSKPFGYSHFISIVQINILMGVLFVGMQSYVILLIRSEVEKLENNANCRFDNLAEEARCTLDNGAHEHEPYPTTNLLKRANEDRTINYIN